MDTVSENFGTCNDLATEEGEQEETKPQAPVIQ